jgi:hypothetical protein
MEFETRDFRNAARLLEGGGPWDELRGVISGISRDDIIAAHRKLNESRRLLKRRDLAGGQTALNLLFRERLDVIGGWLHEPPLFAAGGDVLRGWKMDFLKGSVGVEVSFNHAEAIPWTFTRLDIAGESEEVISAHRIEVGVAIFATQSLKAWARMDNAVGTFERAWEWLRLMKPIIARPILVVGLGAEGWEPGQFRGTARGNRTTL